MMAAATIHDTRQCLKLLCRCKGTPCSCVHVQITVFSRINDAVRGCSVHHKLHVLLVINAALAVVASQILQVDLECDWCCHGLKCLPHCIRMDTMTASMVIQGMSIHLGVVQLAF